MRMLHISSSWKMSEGWMKVVCFLMSLVVCEICCNVIDEDIVYPIRLHYTREKRFVYELLKFGANRANDFSAYGQCFLRMLVFISPREKFTHGM